MAGPMKTVRNRSLENQGDKIRKDKIENIAVTGKVECAHSQQFKRSNRYHKINHCWSLCFQLLILSQTALGALIESPVNTAVVVGETVTLKCKTDADVKLQWKVKTKGAIKIIFNGARVLNGASYKVNTTEAGRFDLQFEALPTYAMLYICYEPGTQSDETAEVIVLETLPACEGLIVQDIRKYKCRVNYTGNWAPQISWHIDRKPVSKLQTFEDTVDNTLTSYMNTSQVQNLTVDCLLAFAKESYNGEAKAENIPVYHDSSITCSLADDERYQSTVMSHSTTTAKTPEPPVSIIVIVIATLAVIALVTFIWFLVTRKYLHLRWR